MKLYKIVLVFLISLSVQSYSQELRVGADIGKGFGKDFETNIMFQGRIGESYMVNYTGFVSQIGANYSKFKYFQFGATVRYKYENKDKLSKNDIDGNQRLAGDVEFKIPENIKRTKIKYRLRYQFSGYNDKGYTEYLRNRIKVNRTMSDDFKSGFSYEFYYNMDKGIIDAHRIKMSLDYKISDSMDLSNFFIVEQNFIPASIDPNAKRLEYNYVLGLMLSVKI